MSRKLILIAGSSVAVLAVVFVLLTGCASSKAFWGDLETGLILMYKLDKDVLKYEASNSQIQNLEIMGSSLQNVTNSTTVMTISPKAKKELNYVVDVTIEDMMLDIKSFQGNIKPDMSGLKGKGLGMTVTPVGVESDFTGVENLKYSIPGAGERNASAGLKTLFPDMAGRPIKVGDTWDTVENIDENEGGMDIHLVFNNKNTLTGTETVDGIECAVISVETQGTMEGTGTQGGMDMTFEGEISAKGSMHFAYQKGCLYKALSDGFIEATIVGTGAQNITIPMTQELKSEMKLMK